MFNVGSVQGYLKLNTTGWNTPMRTAATQLQSLSRSFVRAGMLATGSLLLIEREFGKFDKAIRHATSVSETTEEQFRQMSDMALDASVKWNKAATDTAQAFYWLGSAGLTVTEQMEAFNTTIMLSRAMGSELSSTVEGMIDIVRAFGLEFANSQEIADQLTKTVVSANLDFGDLDQALAYCSSTARMTNNTLAETSAMLGIMADAGIKGSMAGTVLRRAMTNLMSPTGEMAGLIYELGLHIYDAEGKMKPFINIMGEISDKLKGASDEYKNMVFEVLFGRRAIAGQITLFNYGATALRKYATEIKNAGGMTERVAGKQMKAFTEQLGRLWQEVRRVAIELGRTLAPAIERVADYIRDRLVVFREYVAANSAAIAETMKWMAILGASALIFPPLLMIVMSLTNQFVQLALSIGKVGLALATNPLTWLVVALYTLRATLNTNFWKQAWENQIKPFLDVFGRGFMQTITQIMWEFSLIPEAISRAFSSEGILNTIKYFIKALQQIGLVARITAEALTLDFTEADRLSKEFMKLNEEMSVLLFGKKNERGESLGFFRSEEEKKANYQAYLKDLTVFGDELIYQGKTIATDFGEVMRTQIAKDMDSISNLMGTLVDKLPPELKSALDQMIKTFNDLRMLFNEPIITKVEEATGKIGETTQNISETTKEISKTFRDRWMNAITQVIDETETWHDAFVETATDIRNTWASTIEDMMNNGGNFKDFMEKMFLDILHSFNHMVAQFVSNRLFYETFGKILPDWYKPPYESAVYGVKSLGATSPGFGADLIPSEGGAYKATPGVIVNVNNNSGVELKSSTQKPAFDGRNWVVNTVIEAYNTDPNVRAAFGR